MKKIIFVCLVSIVCVFTFVCSAFSQEVMTVSGKGYTVFILCLGDAGDLAEPEFCLVEGLLQFLVGHDFDVPPD